MATSVPRKRPPAPCIGDPEGESLQLIEWRANAGPRSAAEPPPSLKRRGVDKEPLLGTEVVYRERPEQAVISINHAAALNPDARARWLICALENASRGVARPSDIYDILVHPRFSVGVSATVAKRMLAELQRQIELFPDRLQTVIVADDFALATKVTSAQSDRTDNKEEHAIDGTVIAEDIMARCVNFVRQNEKVIEATHKLATRTLQVELERENLQQVWGLTWLRVAFNARRRVLEAIVPNTPAGCWNAAQLAVGHSPLQPGDELVAVNGLRDWDSMANIRNLQTASLTFLREEKMPEQSEACAHQGIAVPLFSPESYAVQAEGGWWAHSSGDWLYSETEKVYFNVRTSSIFLEDPSAPGTFMRVNPGANDTEGRKCPEQATRLAGRVRWFNRAKGFGFIAPKQLDKTMDAEEAEDIFVHKSEILAVATEGNKAKGASANIPLLPGIPLTFSLGLQDNGKLCAVNVDVDQDLFTHCNAGAALGPSCRCATLVPIGIRSAAGHEVTGAFTGLITGRRDVGGCEFIAHRLARHLSSALQGRDQGGEKAARAGLLTAFRHMQQSLLQYAQQLSKNSASLWLSAEMLACSVFVFGPDVDGQPRALFTCAGGGGGLIGRATGSVAASFGSCGVATPTVIPDSVSEEDGFKVFEKGLKGPSIKFPSVWVPGTDVLPRGFGANAWSEKNGVAGGMDLEVHSHDLNWEEDAFLVLGSDELWQALPDTQQAVDIVLESLREHPNDQSPESFAAQKLLDAAKSSRRASDRACALVLRMKWCDVQGECSAREMQTSNDKTVKTVSSEAMDRVSDIPAEKGISNAASLKQVTMELPQDTVDDIFAEPPQTAESPTKNEEDIVDDIFAEPPQTAENPSNNKEVMFSQSGTVFEEASVLAAKPVPLDEPDADHKTPAPSTFEAPIGPMSEMDDMFAEFCKEVGGV